MLDEAASKAREVKLGLVGRGVLGALTDETGQAPKGQHTLLGYGVLYTSIGGRQIFCVALTAGSAAVVSISGWTDKDARLTVLQSHAVDGRRRWKVNAPSVPSCMMHQMRGGCWMMLPWPAAGLVVCKPRTHGLGTLQRDEAMLHKICT